MKQEELQQKFMELQTYEEQIKLIQQQVGTLAQQVMELNMLENSLGELKDVKKETEILVPLGSGIFTKAKLLNTEEVIMGVGYKIHVKKTISDAKKIVKDQTVEMNKIMQQAEEQLQHIALEAQHIQQDIASEMEKSQKENAN